jgi:hypothetical protein
VGSSGCYQNHLLWYVRRTRHPSTFSRVMFFRSITDGPCSFGIFRLTDPPGLQTILECRASDAFHPHPEVPIYTVGVLGIYLSRGDLEMTNLLFDRMPTRVTSRSRICHWRSSTCAERRWTLFLGNVFKAGLFNDACSIGVNHHTKHLPATDLRVDYTCRAGQVNTCFNDTVIL